ncbi:hypothetical protein FH972_003313 [Carpinus fangiana]|uniref:Uncharacterized protein n=1 Tax=Carpinus fangiana TaxID=176857 RepID=A0A5N6QI36_9ROSI|nr:hypothetical protein FH972_003313 [Carpinus fangiana]
MDHPPIIMNEMETLERMERILEGPVDENGFPSPLINNYPAVMVGPKRLPLYCIYYLPTVKVNDSNLFEGKSFTPQRFLLNHVIQQCSVR